MNKIFIKYSFIILGVDNTFFKKILDYILTI